MSIALCSPSLSLTLSQVVVVKFRDQATTIIGVKWSQHKPIAVEWLYGSEAVSVLYIITAGW